MQSSKFVLFCAAVTFAACGDSGGDSTTGGGSGNLFTGGGSGSAVTGGGTGSTTGGGSASTGGGSATGGGSGSTTGGGAASAGGGSATAAGGGTASTGTGGGTATTGTCRELTSWGAADVLGAGYSDEYADQGYFYDWVQAGYATVNGTSGNGDYLEYDYYADSQAPTIPTTGNLTTPFSSCDHCAFVYENCDDSTCGKTYMGNAGTATVNAFTASDAGTFSVTLSDVTFVEWDTDNDAAVSGGACLHLASQSLTGTW